MLTKVTVFGKEYYNETEIVILLVTVFVELPYYTVSQKNAQTLKRYSSKLYRSILMTFGRNIQNILE